MHGWFQRHRVLTLLMGACFLTGYSHQLAARVTVHHHFHCEAPEGHCHDTGEDSDHEDAPVHSGEEEEDGSCLHCLAAPGFVETAGAIPLFHPVAAFAPAYLPRDADRFASRIERPPNFA